MKKLKFSVPVRALKRSYSWRYVSVKLFDEQLESELKEIRARIFTLRNPLNLQELKFFSDKYYKAVTLIEGIIMYFVEEDYFENYTSDVSFLYRGRQVLSLLELLDNYYELSAAHEAAEVKSIIDIKQVLDNLLSVIDQILYEKKDGILIYCVKGFRLTENTPYKIGRSIFVFGV